MLFPPESSRGETMSLSVAVQMDPIDAINPLGDSSFALMLEAQARGHKLSYYTPSTLAQRGNRVSARAHRVSVDDKEKGLHFTLEDWQKTDLADFDVILLRQDPRSEERRVGKESRSGWSASY